MKEDLWENRDKIVVVSKHHSLEEIRKLYDLGFHTFGENRVQELLTKVDSDMDISWHMIGHLQTNKVKEVVKYCDIVQSVDSVKLLTCINEECHKQDKVMPVLLQVNIAEEETKFGFEEDEVKEALEFSKGLDKVIVKGIMVIGPHVEDEKEIARVFTEGKKLFDALKQDNEQFEYLSMGMSSDYPIALACGSNMLRLGTIMFSEEGN